jgi:uncharacterized membrane protein
MRPRLQAVLGGLLLGGLVADNAQANDKPGAAPDFQRDVLPIFEAKCFRCHGEKKKDAKLDMRTVDAMLKGGVTSPAIQPGNAQKSLLIELLHYNEMPPKKETPRVTKEELELLRKWINTMPVSSAATPKQFLP